MIKSSQKYTMFYYNIEQLENVLNKSNLTSALWGISKSKLQKAFEEVYPKNYGMTFNFLKDASPKKDSEGGISFRGLFIVICEKTLSESEMQILLTQYLIEYPSTNRTISENNGETKKLLSEKGENLNLSDAAQAEDLNIQAENIDKTNLIFGVLDDLNHLEAISNIEGIDIIKNFGDFKKIYFSIPSFRQDEVLAHSVTILKSIKCKRSLMDFVTE